MKSLVKKEKWLFGLRRNKGRVARYNYNAISVYIPDSYNSSTDSNIYGGVKPE